MELSEGHYCLLWTEQHNKGKMPGRLWGTTSLLDVEEKAGLVVENYF